MAHKENEITVTVAEVVDYLKMSGRFAPALAEVIERVVTAEAAKKAGLKVSASLLQKGADAFRVANNLNKASDTEDWLKLSGISLEAFEKYLETSLLVSSYKDHLEKKADKGKYLNSPAIKDTVREMIYKDWVRGQLK